MESLMKVKNSCLENSNYIKPTPGYGNFSTIQPTSSLQSHTLPDTLHAYLDPCTLECMTDITVNLLNGKWSKKFGTEVNQVVSLTEFILETAKRSKVTLGVWSLGLLFLLKLQPKDANFEQPSFMDFACCRRRMFMASLMVTSKFTQDKSYKNRTWANIMGVSVAEVNCIELTFLKLIDYQLLIPEKIFLRWGRFLKDQILSYQSKVKSTSIQSDEELVRRPRFSPYEAKSSLAQCRKSLHGNGADRHRKDKAFVNKRKSPCPLSSLLNSPPKETPSSPEIPSTFDNTPPAHPNNVYLTP